LETKEVSNLYNYSLNNLNWWIYGHLLDKWNYYSIQWNLNFQTVVKCTLPKYHVHFLANTSNME
jgi:hypothetical protein